jgi:hypothetical protein
LNIPMWPTIKIILMKTTRDFLDFKKMILFITLKLF